MEWDVDEVSLNVASLALNTSSTAFIPSSLASTGPPNLIDLCIKVILNHPLSISGESTLSALPSEVLSLLFHRFASSKRIPLPPGLAHHYFTCISPTHLDVSGARGVDDALMVEMVATGASLRLESLNLTDCCGVTPRGLMVVGAGNAFPVLQELVVDRCHRIGLSGQTLPLQDGWLAFEQVGAFPALQRLSLQHLPVPQTVLVHLLTSVNINNLDHLDVRHNAAVGVERFPGAFQTFLGAVARLQHLAYSGDAFTSDHAVALARLFPHQRDVQCDVEGAATWAALIPGVHTLRVHRTRHHTPERVPVPTTCASHVWPELREVHVCGALGPADPWVTYVAHHPSARILVHLDASHDVAPLFRGVPGHKHRDIGVCVRAALGPGVVARIRVPPHPAPWWRAHPHVRSVLQAPHAAIEKLRLRTLYPQQPMEVSHSALSMMQALLPTLKSIKVTGLPVPTSTQLAALGHRCSHDDDDDDDGGDGIDGEHRHHQAAPHHSSSTAPHRQSALLSRVLELAGDSLESLVLVDPQAADGDASRMDDGKPSFPVDMGCVLEDALARLASLRHVSLVGLVHVTDDAVASLGDAAGLRRCHVLWCPNTTAAGLRALHRALHAQGPRGAVDLLLLNARHLLAYQTCARYSPWIEWRKPVPLPSLLLHSILPPLGKPDGHAGRSRQAWEGVELLELHVANLSALEYSACKAKRVVLDCPALRWLAIKSPHVRHLDIGAPALRTLRLREAHHVSYSSVRDSIGRCVGLHALELPRAWEDPGWRTGRLDVLVRGQRHLRDVTALQCTARRLVLPNGDARAGDDGDGVDDDEDDADDTIVDDVDDSIVDDVVDAPMMDVSSGLSTLDVGGSPLLEELCWPCCFSKESCPTACSLKKIHARGCTGLSPSAVLSVVEHAPWLASLTMSGSLRAAHMGRVVGHRLQELHVMDCPRLGAPPDPPILSLPANTPMLHRLQVTLCPKLAGLVCGGAHALHTLALSGCPALRRVDLIGLPASTSSTSTRTHAPPSMVEDVTLMQLPRIQLTWLPPSLRRLRIHRVDSLTDARLASMLQACPSLERLHVRACPGLSHPRVASKSIKHLELTRSPNVRAIVVDCPALVSLKLGAVIPKAAATSHAPATSRTPTTASTPPSVPHVVLHACPRLSNLSLHRFAGVDQRWVAQLAGCQDLMRITLHSCTVSQDALLALTCPNPRLGRLARVDVEMSYEVQAALMRTYPSLVIKVNGNHGGWGKTVSLPPPRRHHSSAKGGGDDPPTSMSTYSSSNALASTICWACGRRGHRMRTCNATRDIDGEIISPGDRKSVV